MSYLSRAFDLTELTAGDMPTTDSMAPTAKIAALRPNPNALTQGPIPEKRRAEA